MQTMGNKLRAHGKTVAINLAVVLASVVVACGLGEGVVRLIAPQQLILKRPDIWQPIRTLGWVHRRNISTTINTGERTVEFFTDKDGFRVGRSGRVEADRRILLLGDSFMEALQVEYEQTFAGLLERRLSEQLNESVAVWNTAVGGWDPNHYLLQARRSLNREAYDLALVVLYLGNDIIDTKMNYYPPHPPTEVHFLRIPRSLSWREFVDAVLYPVNDFLEVRSHLFILLKTRAEILRMRLGLTAAYFPVHFLTREAASDRWQITALVCREIADLAKERGTLTIVILIPTDFQVNRGRFSEYMSGFGLDPVAIDIDQPNRLMAAALRAQDLAFVDVTPALERARAGGLKLYGDIDSHLTADAHKVLVETVQPIVAMRLAGGAGGRP